MLIRFTVENFASFNEEQSLSMIKGRETKLQNHVNEDRTGGFETLRGAVIYGANASGKSNLIKALKYAQDFILGHSKISDVDRSFRLDSTSRGRPSSFSFEYKIGGKAYSYGFESIGKYINSEWLYAICVGKQDQLIFSRFPKTEKKANIEFGQKFLESISKQDRDVLVANALSTPDDVLFLTDAKERNFVYFLEPLKWFEEKLRVLRPGSIEPSLLRPDFIDFLSETLRAADTGIVRVEKERIEDLYEVLPRVVTDDILERYNSDNSSKGKAFFFSDRHRIIVTIKDGELVGHRLVTVHKTKSGKEIRFHLHEESDGTRRLVDLAPAFFSKENPDRVLVFDELDRSLHPLITKMLHGVHYSASERSNSQMILATHENYLLNQAFYRRDEVWFIEKDEFGASHLCSLSEYKIRHDKDIEKDYLLGRYGAVPNVRSFYA